MILKILNVPTLAVITDLCVWIALILTVVSLADYLMKNHRVLTEGSM